MDESKKRVGGVCVYDNEDNQDSDWRYLSPKAMRLCIGVENRRRRCDCVLKLKNRRRRCDCGYEVAEGDAILKEKE